MFFKINMLLSEAHLYTTQIGLAAPIFSYILVRTLGFEIYQKAKYQYSAAIGKATGGDEPLVAVNRPGSVPTPATVACFAAAGATSGCLASVVACKSHLCSDSSFELESLMRH